MGGDPQADPVQHLGRAPAGLLLDQARLVVVAEEVGCALDQLLDHRTVGPGQLLRGIGRERDAELATLLGVGDHRLRVAGRGQSPRN